MDMNKMKALAGSAKKPNAAMTLSGKPSLNAPAPPGAEEGEGNDAEMAEGMADRFLQLTPMLEEFAADIEAAAEELDPATLDMDDPLPPEEADTLKSGMLTLDENLVKQLMADFGEGITREDAYMLASHLEEEGMIENVDLVTGYLFHVAMQIVNGEGLSGTGEVPEEEPAPEEEIEEE